MFIHGDECGLNLKKNSGLCKMEEPFCGCIQVWFDRSIQLWAYALTILDAEIKDSFE
jgi:hypothetical protein